MVPTIIDTKPAIEIVQTPSESDGSTIGTFEEYQWKFNPSQGANYSENIANEKSEHLQSNVTARSKMGSKVTEGSDTKNVDPGRGNKSSSFERTVLGKQSEESADKTLKGAPSRAYAEFILRRNLNLMLPALCELQEKVALPDGARCMTIFREALSNVWKVQKGLPREKVILLSAVEETIRGRKWRDFQKPQILALRNTLEPIAAKEFGEKDMSKGFRQFHNAGLDLYPSSPTDEENDFKIEEE